MLSSDELAELKQRAQEGFYCACPHPTAPCDEYQNTGWCVTKFPVMPSSVLLLVETIEVLVAERDELQRRVEAAEDRLAAYVGAREYDDGCLCDVCVRAIDNRLASADEAVAAFQAAREAVSPATTTTKEEGL